MSSSCRKQERAAADPCSRIAPVDQGRSAVWDCDNRSTDRRRERHFLLVERSARERFHKTTLTRAFRHSGGHAGPFGRVTSYIGSLVTSVVWAPVNTRMVTLAGVKSGKDTGQVPVAPVQVALLVDPSGAVTTIVTGV